MTAANSYFDFADGVLTRFVKFDTVRAADTNSVFDSVSTGFTAVAADVTRSLKIPASPTPSDQLINLSAANRANKVVAFNASGNVTAISAGFAWKGDWLTTTVYILNDVVKDPATKNLYVCTIPHTSGTLATDISDGKFTLAINVEDVEAAKTAAEAAEVNAEALQADVAEKQATSSAAAAIATTKRDEAVAAAADAAALFDFFDDRCLGAKAADPATDNDGDPLVDGAWYINSVSGALRAYTAAGGWVQGITAVAGVSSVNGQTGVVVLNLTGLDFSLFQQGVI